MMILSSLVPVLAGALRATQRGAAMASTRLKTLGRALENRRAVRDLAALGDHELKDIGLTRADVRGALEVSWSKDPSQVLRDLAGASHGQAARQARNTLRRPVVTCPAGGKPGLAA